ncbi:MAG TPA: hypothetical protein VJT67_00200, partial [Longimicrobiaceae bacterium]|nr:hypothetical protein [Longimicrobiaceae bacterium]
MDETLKALRAAYYLLLTVCATLLLFGVSTSTTTPYRRALREVDALERIPWGWLAVQDSLNAFALHRPGRSPKAEDTLPLAEVLVRSLGRAEAVPGGRRLVTLPLDRISVLDTLLLVDRTFAVEMAGARSDGPGTRITIAPPPDGAGATLADYETYVRDNPAFAAVGLRPQIKLLAYGDIDPRTRTDLCSRAGRRCVLQQLRASRDSASGDFLLLTKVGGVGEGVDFNMDFTFRTAKSPTGLRLTDWLSRYPAASRLLRPAPGSGQGNALVFLPALKDVWPEVRGLTPGQARLLLTSKIRSSEQPVRFLGLDVPASAIALAAPAVLLALLAHLGLLIQHLRLLLRGAPRDGIRQFPLPLLFPGRSGTFVSIATALVFPLVAVAAMLRRVPLDGAGRWISWLAAALVAALGAI